MADNNEEIMDFMTNGEPLVDIEDIERNEELDFEAEKTTILDEMLPDENGDFHIDDE